MISKVDRYKIMMKDTLLGLMDEVNIFIGLGWKPQGGVTILDMYYIQAMYLEDDK